ncbi:MFS transporter [Streptomyces sp. NPDC018584]|uniref:MFS transporter n=1 Tax=unclassified Streptomyces TaxID=2593676 RepID=UPI0037B1F612
MPSRFASWKAYFALPPTRPQRILVGFIAVDSFGSGLYLTAGLLYLTRSLGLPAAQVGLALSVAGLIALPSGMVVGKLADRFGPRGLTAALLICEGLATLSLTVVRSVPLLAVAATVTAIGMQGGRALRGVLMARAGGEDRLRLRAYSRAAANLAIALGAALAGVAVQVDTREAYLAVIIADTATFFVAALLVRGLPAYAPLPAPPGASRLSVLRNRPFLGVTALNGLMTLQYGVLMVAMPLWVVERTNAPRAMVAATLLLNTLLVVLLQVRVGQRVVDVRAGTRTMRLAGFTFLAACVGFSATGELAPWAAAAALLGLTALLTLGELWHAAASFELSYHLAPEHAHGEYQGVFSLGVSASQAVTPGLLTWLCLDLAPGGWWVLGLVLAATGLLTGPAARLAARHLAGRREVASG